MKRVLCFVFAVVFLFCTVASLTNEPVFAATLRSKKVVSVVYDDSSSMVGADWAYANYAMQTFVSMLNEDDELYITYMSDEGKSVKVNTNDLLSAVKGIRNHKDRGGTPYQAVTTAMEQLEKVNETNPNTQYWLVVFTDGELDETINKVASELDSFKTKPMANGSTPQIMYMTIGDKTDEYTPHPSNQDITVIQAQKEEDVRDSLFDIASRVTGRIQVDEKDITLKDDHTISLSSNVPLLNIDILVQNKNVTVKSIKDSDQNEIPIKYEIPISMPDSAISGATGINEMFGAVTLAGDAQNNIAAGDYTITFSDSISKDDIVIMLEPALQLKIKLFIDGVEVTDTDTIMVSTENLSAKADIYEFGTDNVITESLLPGDVSKQIIFSIDNQVIDSAESLTLDQLPVAEGENSVRASLDISGFFHLETSVDFSPSAIPIIDRIDAELSYDGSERHTRRDGSTDADDVVYVTKLETNRTGIRFTVYQDGTPVSYSTAKSLEKSFREGLQMDFNNYEVEIQKDGSFLVYPSKKPWYVPIDLYYILHHGEQTVGVTLGNANAEGKLDFKLDSIIPPIIGIILYVIWWILFKKHFPKCTLISSTGEKNRRGEVTYKDSEYIDLNWLGCFKDKNIFIILFNLIILLFPMPSKTKFCDYTFSGQYSFVRKINSLLVRNVRGIAVDTEYPTPREESQDTTVEMYEKLYIFDGTTYLKFYIED